jgi:hypothetical protein
VFMIMNSAHLLVKIAFVKPTKQSQGGMCNGIFGFAWQHPLVLPRTDVYIT